MNKRIIFFLTFCSVIFISKKTYTNTGGPGGGYTNAPGENNCTSCHSGSLIVSGSNWSNIKLNGDFTNGKYKKDSTYDIKLSYKQTSINKFGFQITVLDSSNNPIGTLSSNNNRIQKKTRLFGGKTRQYLLHTSNGTNTTSTNSTEWSFMWKAPSSYQGKVKFYSVLLAANQNGSNSGDQVYAKTLDVDFFQDSLPLATASVNKNKVCEGDGLNFKGSATSSPTSYEWIFNGGSISNSSQQNVSNVVFNKAGNYQILLRAKNKNGLGPYDTLQINVLPKPPANWLSSNNQSFCRGDSVNLLAQFVPGASFTWNNAQNGNNIWVNDSGSYNFTVSKSGCSNTSSTRKIQIIEKPVAVLSNGSYCQSFGNTNLDRNHVVSQSGIDSSFWSCLDCKGQDSLLIKKGDSTLLLLSEIQIKPNSIDTLILAYSTFNNYGCSSVDTIQIYVGANPSIVYEQASPLCYNTGVVSLSDFYKIQPSGGSWKVIDSSGFNNPDDLGIFGKDSIKTNKLTNQIYQDRKYLLRYTNEFKGCKTSKDIWLEVLGLDSIFSTQFSFDDTLKRCSNESPLNLDASPSGGIWLINGVKVEETKPGVFESGNTKLSYVFTNEKTACISQKTADILTFPSPQIQFLPMSDTCLKFGKQNISFTTNNQYVDSAYFTFTLNDNIIKPQFERKDSILIEIEVQKPKQLLIYKIDSAFNDQSICPLGSQTKDSIQIFRKPLATILARKQLIGNDEKIKLLRNTDIQSTYTTWQVQPMETGTLVSKDTIIEFRVSQTDNKQFVMVNLKVENIQNQCVETIDSMVNFDQLAGVDLSHLSSISFFPNPVNDILYLQGIQKGAYTLFNAEGKMIREGTFSESHINLDSLPKGSYLMLINSIGYCRFIK